MPLFVVQDADNLTLILIITGAVLCLLSYIARLAAHASSHMAEAGTFGFRLILILNFLGYFGWGYWCGADPVKMNIPSWVSVPVGVFLTVSGLGLFLYSEMKKHGVGEEEELVTTGIYSKIRHPMYVGLVLLHIGFPFIFKSVVAWLSTVVWAGFIAAWTHFEEKNLERRFGQRYTDYKRQTWF
jgi:protein-S-isoprenylcysteine O-methyltransferase Ste14